LPGFCRPSSKGQRVCRNPAEAAFCSPTLLLLVLAFVVVLLLLACRLVRSIVGIVRRALAVVVGLAVVGVFAIRVALALFVRRGTIGGLPRFGDSLLLRLVFFLWLCLAVQTAVQNTRP
jgi:hypothetical protein